MVYKSIVSSALTSIMCHHIPLLSSPPFSFFSPTHLFPLTSPFSPLPSPLSPLLSSRFFPLPPPPHTAPTMITSPPLTTVSAQLNMSFTLPCNATHHPGTDVTYSWRRDGVLLDTSGAALRFVSGTLGDIMIANVQERDAGRYTCTVQTRVQAIAGAGEQIFPPDVSYSFSVFVTSEGILAVVVN